MGYAAAVLVVPRPTARRALLLGRWAWRGRLAAYGETAALLAIPEFAASAIGR